MHAPLLGPHTAFFDFQEDTRSLEGLSPEAQVPLLKERLLTALERAVDFQARSLHLERCVEQLQSEQRARAREHQAFAARTSRELFIAQERVRSLLETIEHAAELDAATPESDVALVSATG